MQLKPGIVADAHPCGRRPYRHWLSRTWDASLPVALVIGINPNTATDTEGDAMTNFLTSFLQGLAGEYRCGGYVLVNCCDFRANPPSGLSTVAEPSSAENLRAIREQVARCSFVIASWGTTNYGTVVENCRRDVIKIVRESQKPVICFSPKGLPIYCSRTSQNSRDGRWSHTPMPWVADNTEAKRSAGRHRESARGRELMTEWVVEALQELGRRGTILDISRRVWERHESDIRAAGDLLYEWQYELRWAGDMLRRDGILRPTEEVPRGIWELA